MLCPCGNPKIRARGLCTTFVTLKRRDQEYFGGLIEALLNFNPLRPVPQTDRIFNDDAGRILSLEYGSK